MYSQQDLDQDLRFHLKIQILHTNLDYAFEIWISRFQSNISDFDDKIWNQDFVTVGKTVTVKSFLTVRKTVTFKVLWPLVKPFHFQSFSITVTCYYQLRWKGISYKNLGRKFAKISRSIFLHCLCWFKASRARPWMLNTLFYIYNPWRVQISGQNVSLTQFSLSTQYVAFVFFHFK